MLFTVTVWFINNLFSSCGFSKLTTEFKNFKKVIALLLLSLFKLEKLHKKNILKTAILYLKIWGVLNKTKTLHDQKILKILAIFFCFIKVCH